MTCRSSNCTHQPSVFHSPAWSRCAVLRRQAVATSANPIISIPKDEQLTRVEIYIVDLGTPENDNGIITRGSDLTTQTGFNKETLVVIISVVGSVLLLVCLVLAVVLIHTRRSPRTPQHPLSTQWTQLHGS